MKNYLKAMVVVIPLIFQINYLIMIFNQFYLPQELKDRILARVPVGRFGQAEEVANLVGYIASDMASYITGQVVAIDGGMLIG